MPFPSIPAKENKDGEHFQTAQDHAEGENQLAQVGKGGKIAHRTHRFQTGTDVICAGNDGSQSGSKREIIQTDDQRSAEDHEHAVAHEFNDRSQWK